MFNKVRVTNLTQGEIRAIEKLEEERRERNFEDMSDVNHGRIRKTRKVHAVPKGVASNEMCTFLILNISSIQLIPVNMIAYE